MRPRILGVLFTILLAASCSDSSKASGPLEVTIFAASSLRNVILELEPMLEEQLGANVSVSYGSSGDLARQIAAGAKAEVFLSADEKEMDRLDGLGLLEKGSRRDWVSNQLVVIEPFEESPAWKSGFAMPFTPAQLAAPRIAQLSLGNPDSVPAGRYAKAWLEKAGVWSEVSGRVLPAIDVRAALAAVESGGAQAGIVYKTDAAHSKRVHVAYEVPREEGPTITYPIAALAESHELAAAKKLLDLLGSERATAVLQRHDFGILPLSR
ncbi:MAG TPA: molybdate ABC transporter substrate-binding protein [Planctomycetota bacterium]|nr:molybdate ABC transporter substrate-binding protein [Planctomycetota bacterium]